VTLPLLEDSLTPAEWATDCGVVATNGGAFPLCGKVNFIKCALGHMVMVSSDRGLVKPMQTVFLAYRFPINYLLEYNASRMEIFGIFDRSVFRYL